METTDKSKWKNHEICICSRSCYYNTWRNYVSTNKNQSFGDFLERVLPYSVLVIIFQDLFLKPMNCPLKRSIVSLCSYNNYWQHIILSTDSSLYYRLLTMLVIIFVELHLVCDD